MDTQDCGTEGDIQNTINYISSLVQSIVDLTLTNAINMVGKANKHVIKAQERYNEALAKLTCEKYDKAIKKFSKAYKETIKHAVNGFQILHYSP